MKYSIFMYLTLSISFLFVSSRGNKLVEKTRSCLDGLTTPRQKLSSKIEIECGTTYKLSSRLNHSNRIVAGEPAKPGEFPWQAGIYTIKEDGCKKFTCGGVLIDESYVLTAAHCLKHCTDGSNPENPKKFIVALGDYNKHRDGDGELYRPIDNYICHNKSNYGDSYDIALIKLAKRAKYKLTSRLRGNINRVCMPNGDAHLGDRVISTGWGALGKSKPESSLLQYASMNIVECLHEDPASRAQMICARYSGSKAAACFGDSGGPLVWRDDQTGKHFLLGIVASGVCDGIKAPTYYVKVSYFLHWIDKVKNELG